MLQEALMKLLSKVFGFTLIILIADFFQNACSLPQQPEGWSVMSWNVQNLFDAADDGSEYPEFDPGNGKWNKELYNKRLENTCRVIKEINRTGADLVILQELEKPSVLNDLAEFGLKDSGYNWSFSIDGPQIIRSGVLSRYPISSVRAVESPFNLRPVIVFNVSSPVGTVTVITVHWKSPREGVEKTEYLRVVQAGIVRNISMEILDNNSSAKILIIGDFNTSGDSSAAHSALAPWFPETDTSSDNSVLYYSPFIEACGIRKSDPVFYNPENREKEGGTYWYKNNWFYPDHALLSRNLAENNFKMFKILKPEYIKDSEGHPLMWKSWKNSGYSDHFPITVYFSN
jgi:hypothetical protein